MKFEYHIYNSFKIGGVSDSELVLELNRLGALGWELTCMQSEFRFVFRRAVEE